MKYTRYDFLLANTSTEGNTEVATVLSAGDKTFLCRLYFDTDETSMTYNKWSCSLELVSDEAEVAERSFVLNPGTVFFKGDDLYTVAIVSELDVIGLNDLQDVVISIGVPINE